MTNYCLMCVGYLDRIAELESRWTRIKDYAASMAVMREDARVRAAYRNVGIALLQLEAPSDGIDTSEKRVEEMAKRGHDR